MGPNRVRRTETILSAGLNRSRAEEMSVRIEMGRSDVKEIAAVVSMAAVTASLSRRAHRAAKAGIVSKRSFAS